MRHFLLLASLCLWSVSNANGAGSDEDVTPRIGIIGAGMSGTSSAYYLRQLFGPKATIDVFEAERVGGRTALINISGQQYEAGGSIIHNKNTYMVQFAKMFNASTNIHAAGVLGLYGDDGIRFQTSEWTAVTLAKLAWRYGMDLYTIQDWTKSTIFQKFARIYDFQDRGMAFTSVEDMLKAMGEEMLNLTRHTMKDVLLDAGLSKTFIDEFGAAAMRNNYGQTTEAHGFVGAMAMFGSEPGLWSVQGGNKLIAENLLKASGATLVKGTVTTVALIKDELGSGSVSYELEYTKGGNPESGSEKEKDNSGSREYDILVVATPLEGTNSKINFVEFPRKVASFKQEFHKTVAMFVQGKINTTTFKVSSQEEFPADLFVISPDVFFSSIGKLSPTSPDSGSSSQASENGEAVWKAFLNKVPTEEEIGRLFESRSDLRLVEWWAYPKYHKGMDLPPFMLYDRLYYVNAVESAAAAMEMNVIGARNVALLAYNQWQGNFDKIDEIHLPSSSSSSSSSPSASVDDKEERSDL